MILTAANMMKASSLQRVSMIKSGKVFGKRTRAPEPQCQGRYDHFILWNNKDHVSWVVIFQEAYSKTLAFLSENIHVPPEACCHSNANIASHANATNTYTECCHAYRKYGWTSISITPSRCDWCGGRHFRKSKPLC